MARPLSDRVDSLEETVQSIRTLVQQLASQPRNLAKQKLLNAETTEAIASGDLGEVRVYDHGDPGGATPVHQLVGPAFNARNWLGGDLPTARKCYLLERPWNEFEILDMRSIRVIEFRLTEALTTAMSLATARIVHMWIGGGALDDAVTVYNTGTNVGGVYLFHGDSGAHGWAIGTIDSDDTGFLIGNMQC